MAARRQSKDLSFDLDGRAVPLTLKRNRRAQRIIIRVDPKTDGIKMTLPWHASEAEGIGFLRTQEAWVRRRLAKLEPRTPFTEGATIKLLDDELRIVSRPDARRGAWIEDGALHVSGKPEHLARRVTDWLKKEAKRRLVELSQEKAARLGVSIGRVAVRDTVSRWGSCAHDGSLNYSWRLVMAPGFVFDFIVAHEVAHIIERNHGPNFHRLVDTLTPEAERAEAWLSVHGSKLHRIG